MFLHNFFNVYLKKNTIYSPLDEFSFKIVFSSDIFGEIHFFLGHPPPHISFYKIRTKFFCKDKSMNN